MVLSFGLLGYLILIWLGLIVDDYILTRRHVRMFKQVMTDELRKLKAEALAMPGGKVESYPVHVDGSLVNDIDGSDKTRRNSGTD